MKEHGDDSKRTGAEVEALLALAHGVGADRELVQPGGGNISLKHDRTDGGGVLLIKGSGSDLATLEAGQLTRLYLDRLTPPSAQSPESDDALVARLRRAMLRPDVDLQPSLETPLHAIIPAAVVLHTHDLVTLALTNRSTENARRQVREIFGDSVAYLPYARPGAPLAHLVTSEVASLGDDRQALMLAHHGLVTWGDTPADCRRRLDDLLDTARRFMDAGARKEGVFGVATPLSLDEAARRERAGLLLPVLRGTLERDRKRILRFEDAPPLLDVLSRKRFSEVAARGMATPDHILWAGRRPLWLDLDLTAPEEVLAESARRQIHESLAREREIAARHLPPDQEPLTAGAAVLLVPGLGMITAADDARQALVAAESFSATREAMEQAEALGGYRPLDEADAVEFEHWPLERRKLESLRQADRKRELSGHVVLIVGGGSGIGEAAAESAVGAGAHVVVADLDAGAAEAVAESLDRRRPGHAVATAMDVRDDASIADAVRHAVLAFGGLDGLFYTAGRAPSFARVVDLSRDELRSQLEIHYLGAMMTLREAARVMRRQGRGGSIVCSVSKAALAPGKEAAAYGGSKAALQHALRIAALELGEDDIRVNAINADQVDTPLFRRFVAARARAAGRTVDEQLSSYRGRNALGRSLIPAGAVGDLVALLLGRRFLHTTGDILTIDGGLPDAFPR